MNDRDERIRALLSGNACRYLEARMSTADIGSYAKVFAFSRAEIDAHVREHGLPDNAYATRPSLRDGLYVVPSENGQSEVYYQERGIKFPIGVASDSNEVQCYVIDHLLNLSGTGLKFD